MSTATINGHATSKNTAQAVPLHPVPDREDPPEVRAETPPKSDTDDFTEDAEVAAFRAELGKARIMRTLQGDPVLLDVLSSKERKAERKLAEDLRSEERAQRKRAASAERKRQQAEQRTTDELADAEQSDRVWSQRALFQRKRLLDPIARLARLQQVRMYNTRAWSVLAGLGIAFGAVNVQNTLTDGKYDSGQAMWWIGFIVEPLASVPLVILLLIRAVSAQWGRQFRSRKVAWFEGGLLAAMVFLNAGSCMPMVGTWVDVFTLVWHMAPPLLLASAVFLHSVTSAHLADLLMHAYQDAGDAAGRMQEAVYEQILLMTRIREARISGELAIDTTMPENAKYNLPSVTKAQAYLNVKKQKVQQAFDGLRLMFRSVPDVH